MDKDKYKEKATNPAYNVQAEGLSLTISVPDVLSVDNSPGVHLKSIGPLSVL
jgi:hypothetical protein